MTDSITRRNFLGLACTSAAAAMTGCRGGELFAAGGIFGKRSNIVVIFADDLGYGDLSCLGHPTLMTDNLDRMAAEGIKLTQFYSAASVCTPSRAALLTGRLPIRSGMCGNRYRVLFPFSRGGLPAEEITVAEALKKKGYSTCCIGKWHVGHLAPYLPRNHGFDYYYGIPYSNDMHPTPLMRNEEVIEKPARQNTLTKRYTEEALNFIEENKEGPFFLYFAHTFPHVPLFSSEDFDGTSRRGLYGDVVEELDWSVGQILGKLKSSGIDNDTLVMFTSDNGPWLAKKLHGGSAGLLRGGKGTSWEGGFREPFIARWPGKITAGTVSAAITSTLDIMPTCLSIAGAGPPKDRIIDGRDMSEVLRGSSDKCRELIFYYIGERLTAVRKGPWKAHLVSVPENPYGAKHGITEHEQPLLFQLEHDPSEKYDISAQYPEVVAELKREIEKHRATVKHVESQLDKVNRKKQS